MVAHMPRVLRCAFIDRPALIEGRWRGSLTRLLQQPAPPEHPGTDGAAIAAGMIAARLDHA